MIGPHETGDEDGLEVICLCPNRFVSVVFLSKASRKSKSIKTGSYEHEKLC